MKRVDIKSRAVLKGQGPKMLPGYYKYWKKHDTCSIMSGQSGVGLRGFYGLYKILLGKNQGPFKN